MFSEERLEYLRKKTILSPVNSIKLKKLKKTNLPQSEIDQAEFVFRFQAYQKKEERLWKKLNWGESENESLSDFALSSLDQEINKNTSKVK